MASIHHSTRIDPMEARCDGTWRPRRTKEDKNDSPPPKMPPVFIPREVCQRVTSRQDLTYPMVPTARGPGAQEIDVFRTLRGSRRHDTRFSGLLGSTCRERCRGSSGACRAEVSCLYPASSLVEDGQWGPAEISWKSTEAREERLLRLRVISCVDRGESEPASHDSDVPGRREGAS